MTSGTGRSFCKENKVEETAEHHGKERAEQKIQKIRPVFHDHNVP